MEGAVRGGAEEYVEVVHDYSYQREGRCLQMIKGEVFMLLKRSTNDWWQVIRQGEQRPFYAPTQYIRLTTIPLEKKKLALKQGRLKPAPGDAPGGFPLSKGSSTSSLADPPSQSSYVAKIEPARVARERSEAYQTRPSGFSSFRSESPLVPPKGSMGPGSDFPSPTASSKGFPGQESSSSHTSKSSLNEGSRCSMESLSQLHLRQRRVKAASHDELLYGERSHSVLDVRQPRAASSEELDQRHYARDFSFKSNQLSHRHRSNSVDFRIFQKELSFSELKQGSLDKSRKPRLSRDPGNRRRSWAVEEVRVPDHYRASYKRAETLDAAIVLDVPPKLPPKQRKHKHDPFGSSTELEGPIDVKVQEVKQVKPPALPLTGPNVKRLSQDFEKGTSRPLADDNKGSLRRHEEHFEPPVALPRKLIPPQVQPTEAKIPEVEGEAASPSESPNTDKDRPELRPRTDVDKENRCEYRARVDPSKDQYRARMEPTLSPVRTETISIDVKKKITSPKLESHERIERTSSFKRNGNTRLSSKRNPPGTPEMARRGFGTPEMNRKVYGAPPVTPESVRKTYSLPMERGSKDAAGHPSYGHFHTDVAGAFRGELAEEPDPAWSGKPTVPCPSSPSQAPKRLMFDDWGEYVDDGSGRVFYYNARTREKRWKPPRKGIHSVAIPEVPPHAPGSLGRNPGQPTSPTHSKPWSYGTLPEGGAPTNYPPARSQTLPSFPHTSRNHHGTSFVPPVPPHIPTLPPLTPTLPPQTPTLPPHTPTLPPHTPTIPPHAPTIPTHAPTVPAHVPTIPSHAPTIPSTIPSHAPTISHAQTVPLHAISSTPHIPMNPLTTSQSTHSLPHATNHTHIPPSTSNTLPPTTPLNHTNQTYPIAPPSSAKPHVPTTPTSPANPEVSSEAEQNSALLDTLYNLSLPRGWCKKYDAYTQRVFFLNLVTGERWLATNNDEGKIYYYEEHGTDSRWKLQEMEYPEDAGMEGREDSQLSTLDNQRISLVSENLTELFKNVCKEGFLHRTYIYKDGKKVRKNWTCLYARYILGSFNSGSLGLIYFSKSKDENKKAEVFDLAPPISLDATNDKKTSRQQVLGLHNGHNTEVLLQFDDKDIANEWFKVLERHEGMQVTTASGADKDDKKNKRASDKMKRAGSVEQLNPDNKGITDKLRNFIKRRPLKETLEKKGIYKEAVFGSTLAELAVQDKTRIPLFVLQCVKHIQKSEENLTTDGLYRISGNAAQIQKIRYEVAQRNYTILSQEKDVHNLSGALKLFFRELKEPLVPFDNYHEFIQATGSEFRKRSQQVERLAKAVKHLPEENYETLKFLLQHLLRVSEFESQNRMNISNLAIVFGPCLLSPRVTTSHDLMTDVMLHNRVIEELLADFDKIFVSRK